ncbi:MAG TPA: SMC-Scp complex subunit ScpB [Solirubrobacteraceae bacterium]|nr:SMC-Scp complex subunit ScpB [Solirubrobacteraceae bacterium]
MSAGTTTATELERTIEALLFLSSDPVSSEALADAADAELHEVVRALERLREHLEFDRRGLVVREVAGGWSLSSHPDAEVAARRLLSRPRTPPLTPAQAETLSIIAYLQPVSRPEIARIRGVNAESAAATLLERGMIEEAGRSQFGAVLYRTTDLFLRLFGLNSTGELPDPRQFDPSPEVEEELRERLLRVGDVRAGRAASGGSEPADEDEPADGDEPADEGEPADEDEPAGRPGTSAPEVPDAAESD